MTSFFKSSSSLKATRLDTAIWAARLVLICAGIISTAVFFKVVVIPYIFNFLISTLPNCWDSFKSWLSPPYIYIIVNFIIITIVASSNFHAYQKHPGSSILETKTTETAKDGKNQTKTKSQDPMQDVTWEDMLQQEEEKQELKSGILEHCMDPSEEIFLTDSTESGIEEGKLLNQAAADEIEPGVKEDDTLDATWKAIMEGQGKVVTKQLKKSETWNKPPQMVRAKKPTTMPKDDIIDSLAWAKKELRKSDTFNDSGSLRREKSMSQDELNKRVESFIKKMKLKRLESEHEQRLIEISNRCVY